jgi:hypothetical protein
LRHLHHLPRRPRSRLQQQHLLQQLLPQLLLQLQVLVAASIEEVNVIKHKDVAGTVTLKNAAMLCQLWNVRHLIIKDGIAKITDVNGRIMKRNVKEGGVGAPEIIYRSRL